MYAKKLWEKEMEKEKCKVSFRDFVKEYYIDYGEEIEGEISDEKIMEFLENRYFYNDREEYNDGWAKYKDMDKDDLCIEYIKEELVEIEFDDKFSFDDV